jgi:hypothetical protein
MAGDGDAVHGYIATLDHLWSLALRDAQTETFAEAFYLIGLCFLTATGMVPLMCKVAAPPKRRRFSLRMGKQVCGGLSPPTFGSVSIFSVLPVDYGDGDVWRNDHRIV